METGTPRWAASSVSAQPHRARASARTDARVTNERITELLETDRARRGLARPKGSGFSSGCEPVSHAERQVESRVETHAEHAHVPATLQPFIVVRDVRAENTEAQIGAEHIAELRRGARSRVAVPDPGREVRLDAEPRSRKRNADPGGADQRGLLRGHPTRAGAGSAQLHVDSDRQQTAANQTKSDVSTHRRQALCESLRLPARDAGRKRDRRETERCPAAPRVALAVI